MTIRLGVVMDPISQINPAKDSTLAMLLAASRRGWDIHYMELPGLILRDGSLHVQTRALQVADDRKNWYQTGSPREIPAANLDIILMRKDPPFDMEYIYATYLLEVAEEAGVLVSNRPGSIRDNNEKLFATRFPSCTPPLVVSRDPEVLAAFYAAEGDVIFKPLDGMGGEMIFRVQKGDSNLNVILETLTSRGGRRIMAQRYIPEVSAGDTRILLIDGEPLPFGLARVPPEGENRGNLAAGGKGVGRELGERDRFICAEIGPRLRAAGLHFVGIDVIGDYLTEINVTCPTCIRELDQMYGLDIAGQYLDCLAAKLAERGRG